MGQSWQLRAVRRARVFAVVVALAGGYAGDARSQTGSGLPLPPGQVIVGPVYRGLPFSGSNCPPGSMTSCVGTSVPSITTGVNADAYLFPKYSDPPFTPGASALVVQTTAPTQYVRFYLPGTAGAVGGFIVGSNEVRGLTATQIQSVLALPYTPTMETLVQVPAGTCLLVGPANPLYGQPGGAVQEFLVGRSQGGAGCGPVPQFLSASSFIDQQAIGAYALAYAPRAGGGNVGAVAAALDHGPYPALFSPMDGMYNALDVLNYGDPAPLRSALAQLDGEVYASARTVMLSDSLYLREAVLGRMRQAAFVGGAGPMAALTAGGPTLAYADTSQSTSDAGLAYADARGPAFPIKAPPASAPPPATVFWAQGIGAWGRFEGNGNAADVSRNLAGVFAGADRQFGSNWLAGLAAGYTNSFLDIADLASSANINTGHVAGYAAAAFGPWNVRGAAAGAFSALDTGRSVAFPGFTDSASASYDATTAQVFGEVGYGLALGPIAAEPLAGLAFVHLNTGGFTEGGGTGAAALGGSSGTDDVGYSTLGARAASAWVVAPDMTLIPHAAALWQHAIGPVTPTAALAFATTGAPFTVSGVPLARDAALVEAGVDLRINAQVTLAVFYSGNLAGNVQDNAIQGNVRWRF